MISRERAPAGLNSFCRAAMGLRRPGAAAIHRGLRDLLPDFLVRLRALRSPGRVLLPDLGDDRSVKIKSLEAAKIMKIKSLVLGCIEANFCGKKKSKKEEKESS